MFLGAKEPKCGNLLENAKFTRRPYSNLSNLIPNLSFKRLSSFHLEKVERRDVGLFGFGTFFGLFLSTKRLNCSIKRAGCWMGIIRPPPAVRTRPDALTSGVYGWSALVNSTRRGMRRARLAAASEVRPLPPTRCRHCTFRPKAGPVFASTLATKNTQNEFRFYGILV